MKIRIAFGVMTMALVGATYSAVGSAQAKTVWEGVFTDAQATRGLAAYKASCSECHGGDLAGDGFAPGLVGAEFMGNWNATTVGELFDRIKSSMPPSDPESVTPAQKIDIVAYMLSQNKVPAGKTELELKPEVLKTIKIEVKK